MIDVTKYDFGGRLRAKKEEILDYATLVDLANERLAFVYQRLSSHEQVKRHIWSVEVQDALAELARKDGYPDSLIYIEQRDLGISGTKGREDRPGLSYLIELIETGKVEAVYVVHISRLYRDQTLINALALGELFKEYGVIIVTPQMRLNLRDKMHMRMYRVEVERAADELELMASRLLGARDLKAKSGRYGGESLPSGYILDENRNLPNGEDNPDYHTCKEYKPHAEVVSLIFDKLATGMTQIQVVRYCGRHGIVFPFFPPELDTPANRKTFLKTKTSGSGWIITIGRVRGIARNPAYIGWRVWAGEVVSKDVLLPIVEEEVFWRVQKRFNGGTQSRPRKDIDPLPLAGLLHCGKHDVPRRMSYSNQRETYECCDYVIKTICTTITARYLDGPVSEAVISQISLPGLAEKTLHKLTDEYEQAKEQAASYRREMRRMEAEVESLRGNLMAGILSADQLQWVDQQIQERLARIRELADLETRPIGRVVGHPIPGQTDIELLKSWLDDLGQEWPKQPNGFKNAFLRLLFDKIVVWYSGQGEIRVRLIWRVGLEPEILIHLPPRGGKRPAWSNTEMRILREHYETATRNELMAMLPERSWESITCKARHLGLTRSNEFRHRRENNARYTQEEDDLIRQYYASEIGIDEVLSTGRVMTGIRRRARILGLERQTDPTWKWISGIVENGNPSTPTARQ